MAYVQLTRDHRAVCDAVMAFAEIEFQKSFAQKLLFYPREWDAITASGTSKDKSHRTSMRLMKNASLKYGVSLYPIDPMLGGDVAPEVAYPIVGLLSLTRYERLLLLQPGGLVLDTKALDNIFMMSVNASVVTFIDISSDEAISLATLVKPSAMAYRLATDTSLHDHGREHIQLHANQSVGPVGPLRHSSMLRFPGPVESNIKISTAVGYMKFSDKEILGPEYNTPKSIWQRARPEHFEQRQLWEGLYERYRERRMEICGLDLEPMPIPEM